MTTLILPDLHLRHELADEIVANVKPDAVVCVGDYFDDFYDTVRENKEMAEWVKDKLRRPEWTLLIGNHDFHYRWKILPVRSCGFECPKDEAINSVLSNVDWFGMRFYCWVGDWLVTHAGLSFRHKEVKKVKDFKKFMPEAETEALISAAKGENSWFYGVGRARDGNHETGGITWCDFREEFTPVPGLKQVFGHTPLSEPLFKDNSVCIDTHTRHYAVHDGDSLKIFDA